MYKVLVVDDSAAIRRSIARMLPDYTIVEARHGAEGLEKLAAESDIALVICDVNMPGMTGLDMLAECGKTISAVLPPVLMLTVETDDDLVQRGRRCGVSEWVTKPFTPAALKATVQRLLGVTPD